MSGMLGLNVSCHHVTFLDLGQPLFYSTYRQEILSEKGSLMEHAPK